MLNILLLGLALLEGVPILGKFFGWIPADVVALNEDGSPYNTITGSTTKEPVYTKTKPSGLVALLAGFSIYFSFKNARL